MSTKFRGGLFVTGTDTGIGKTFVTAALLQAWRISGVRTGGYKPAASGCEYTAEGQPFWGDVEALYAATGGEFPREAICPQTFREPLAPPIAATFEQRNLDADRLISGADWWKSEVDVLLVEGAGGLLSPLSESWTNADVAQRLGFPLLIVARSGLGTINHTLLTVEAAQRRGLSVSAILLNGAQSATSDVSIQSNFSELQKRCEVPVLGVLPHFTEGDLLRYPPFLRMAETLGRQLSFLP